MHQINQAFKQQNERREEISSDKVDFLSFFGPITARNSRLLFKQGIKTIFRPLTDVWDSLWLVKDNLGLRTPGIYSISCECGSTYIWLNHKNCGKGDL